MAVVEHHHAGVAWGLGITLNEIWEWPALTSPLADKPLRLRLEMEGFIYDVTTNAHKRMTFVGKDGVALLSRLHKNPKVKVEQCLTLSEPNRV